MSNSDRLPLVKQRIKTEVGAASRFAIVGATATGVHAATAVGLLEFGILSAFPANIVGFMIAFCVSFTGHHFWSFGASRHDAAVSRRMRRFFTLAASGFALNSTALAAWLQLTPWPDALGILFSIAVVPGLTFLGSRLWAFSGHSQDKDV
ncbi:putative flippase GtrA [Roseibium hamelinense]|uniref:Putative flippase GtrA n=1 Tax=Roseibium hamelinense TaxID=150831 RepID=A0A562SF85_9HYPH|nr:GtrA family protein [Roseibium hamelinense]MTI42866.1 GtrA family protein [Roseibium hamelinense]TWI79898.1 putative flippase GtrA [Roseibium hamelinense]